MSKIKLICTEMRHIIKTADADKSVQNTGVYTPLSIFDIDLTCGDKSTSSFFNQNFFPNLNLHTIRSLHG